MIVSHRRTALEARGAYLETHALVHTTYRVHVVRNDRVVSEDRLLLRAFDRKGALGRPVVTVVLDGAARLEAYDRIEWLGVGRVSAIEAKGAVTMRQSRSGERYEALVIEWDPGSLAPARPHGFEVHALAAERLAVVRAAADALASPSSGAERAAAELGAVLDVLREVGLPFVARAPETLVEEVSPQSARLATALDDLLSDLRRRPMAVDLHQVLGLSLRQVNRLVLEFNRRYGFNAVGWRDTRGRRRLMIGATLMTTSGATVEEVARAVGYASATAFARAMARAGLPPPGEVARAVEALR